MTDKIVNPLPQVKKPVRGVEFQIKPLQYGSNTAVRGFWNCIKYNGTDCIIAWGLTTETGIVVATGAVTFKKDVFDSWGSDDQVITDALIAKNKW